MSLYVTIDTPHVLFAGGVTGGHLFPGLAVAEELTSQLPETQITFAGPGGPFDREQVTRQRHDYVQITSPRPPHDWSQWGAFAQRLMRGYREAMTFLRHHDVSVVVGLGGYASVPTAIAAARLRVPLVLLEQNAIPGAANRLLARFARRICLSFAPRSNALGETRWSARHATIVTGTPVRRAFFANHAPVAPPSPPLLVVLGGSGGSNSLNTLVPTALARLHTLLGEYHVVHQAGPTGASAAETMYREAGIQATVVPFLDDVAPLLARAKLVISRSGGATLAELAVTGTPAMLIPWGAAKADHQRRNARQFVEAGAAEMLDADALPAADLAPRLATRIEDLLTHPMRLQAMSRAIRRLAREQASARIAEMVLKIAGFDPAQIDRSPNQATYSRTARIDSRAA